MPLPNQTRVSASIPRRLLRERRLHLLPLYYALRPSFLAREAIERSGSRHFADHIYVGKPKGAWGVGEVIDSILLSLPSSRSFRNRYIHTRDGLIQAVVSSPREIARVLTAPCGIPRELAEAAEHIRRLAPERFDQTTFFGIDLDPAAIVEAREFLQTRSLGCVRLIEGDALRGERLPGDLDAIASTGFAEFLDDADVVRFYANCHERLRPGGVLLTSATVEHKLSSYLLRNIAELSARYREEADIARLFRETPFGEVRMARDPVGYQVLITAVRA